MSTFSRRSTFSELENPLTRALGRLRQQGKPVLSLIESNPTAAGLALSAEELLPLLSQTQVARYEPTPFGLWSAREVLAQEFAAQGFEVAPDAIMLTASTSEAYGYLFRLLCDPGDAVMVPAPSYPLFDTLAQLEGVELVPYRLAYDGEWHLDSSELARARDERVKAIIVVHPNNPTGHFLKRAELKALAAFRKPILSDEVFAEYALCDASDRATSVLEIAQEVPVFRMGGLSKSAALPQLKLAWTAVAGPSAETREALRRLEHIADAYLSPNAQVQLALPHLLRAAAPVRARIRVRCAENLAALKQTFAGESAVSPLRVEGGWYAILRLPEVLDEDAWVLAFLERDHVLVQPGYFYELGRGAYVVLSLITPPSEFAEGVRRLQARVEALTRA